MHTKLITSVAALFITLPHVVACGSDDCARTLTCDPALGGNDGEGGTTSSGGNGGTSSSTGGGGSGGGTTYAPGDVIWERSFGDSGEDVVAGAQVLSDGRVVLGGWFEGTIDLGNGPLAASEADLFLARFSALGDLQFAKRFGGAGDQTVADVAVTSKDEVWLIGEINSSSINFGNGDLSTIEDDDSFVAKLDVDGTGLAAIRIGSPCNAMGMHVAVSLGDAAVASGNFCTDLTIDTTLLPGNGQYTSLFATGFNPDVSHKWSKAATTFADSGIATEAIAAGPGGVAALVMNALDQQSGNNNMTFNGVTFGPQALFVVTATGGNRWNAPFNRTVRDVSFWPNGDLLVCGAYSGTGSFPKEYMLPFASGQDVWAARFSPTGSLRWARRFGGPDRDGGLAHGVRCHALEDDSFVVAAGTEGDFAFGSDALNGQDAALVIAQIGDSGDVMWSRRSTGDGKIVALHSQAERVVLTASSGISLGFETATPSMGGRDVFAVTFSL